MWMALVVVFNLDRGDVTCCPRLWMSRRWMSSPHVEFPGWPQFRFGRIYCSCKKLFWRRKSKCTLVLTQGQLGYHPSPTLGEKQQNMETYGIPSPDWVAGSSRGMILPRGVRGPWDHTQTSPCSWCQDWAGSQKVPDLRRGSIFIPEHCWGALEQARLTPLPESVHLLGS